MSRDNMCVHPHFVLLQQRYDCYHRHNHWNIGYSDTKRHCKMHFGLCHHSEAVGWNFVICDVYDDVLLDTTHRNPVDVYWVHQICRGERRWASWDRNVWVFYVYDPVIEAVVIESRQNSVDCTDGMDRDNVFRYLRWQNDGFQCEHCEKHVWYKPFWIGLGSFHLVVSRVVVSSITCFDSLMWLMGSRKLLLHTLRKNKKFEAFTRSGVQKESLHSHTA